MNSLQYSKLKCIDKNDNSSKFKMVLGHIWIFLVLPPLLMGCDFGKNEREAADAIYKSNADAAKKCEAKLRGLKRVPIAGTDGKLFLNSEVLSMWNISRDFRVGDECGAKDLGATQTFYWDGESIISQHNWIYRDKKSQWLIDEKWISFSADVIFGTPNTCKTHHKNTALNCNVMPPDKDQYGVIRLKHHPLDAWPVRDQRQKNVHLSYQLSLRDWPKDNGWPRTLRYACELKGMSESEIENIIFSKDSKHRVCELDFYDFDFNAGSARINFDIKHANQITTILKNFQKYLNDAISEE